MQRTEKTLKKCEQNMAYENMPLPTLSARLKNCRRPKTRDNSKKIDLEGSYSCLNNVLHIELTNDPYPMILAILKHIDENGELRRVGMLPSSTWAIILDVGRRKDKPSS